MIEGFTPKVGDKLISLEEYKPRNKPAGSLFWFLEKLPLPYRGFIVADEKGATHIYDIKYVQRCGTCISCEYYRDEWMIYADGLGMANTYRQRCLRYSTDNSDPGPGERLFEPEIQSCKFWKLGQVWVKETIEQYEKQKNGEDTDRNTNMG